VQTTVLVLGFIGLLAVVVVLIVRRQRSALPNRVPDVGNVDPARRGEPDSGRAVLIDPAKIVFPTPTLSFVMPPLRAPPDPDPGDAFWIDEDDWGQVEFVSVDDLDTVMRELDELRVSRDVHWTGQGWDVVFLRKSRPEGLLPRSIPFSDLGAIVPMEAACPVAVGLRGRREADVVGGFALELVPGVVLYGHAVGDRIASLGLECTLPDVASSPAASVLGQMCGLLRLRLVDWNKGILVDLPESPRA
jgi:hypothetical protein